MRVRTAAYVFAFAEYSIRGIEGLRSTRLGELRPLRALPRKPYIYIRKRMYISNKYPRCGGGLARITIRIRNSSASRVLRRCKNCLQLALVSRLITSTVYQLYLYQIILLSIT